MSWLDELAAELRARAVPGRERHRILIELRDHIACEPGCEDRLGDPRALAVTFADELATDRARSSAFTSFAALAVAAVVLALSQLMLARFTRYPGYDSGLAPLLFMPAALGMLVVPQVAFVAGTLAAWRAIRRRRVVRMPAQEIALIHRRTRVALGAGLGTMAGLELYVIDFAGRLPVWWLALFGGLAAAACGALAAAWRNLSHAQAIRSSAAGAAGDIFDDLPLLDWRWLRSRPWLLGALASLAVGLALGAFEARVEHSVIEGVQRGVFEGLAAVAGFALLGRAIGAFPPTARAALPADTPDQLVSDAERANAEAVLRESYADGRVTLEELDDRISAVHAARTLSQLRAALTGLPPHP